MNIQWFPGHMAKTRKILSENLKLVDIVIELLDARIPKSSKNPEINTLLNNKLRIVAFNKADLADPAISRQWEEYYKKEGISTLFIDSIKGKGINDFKLRARELMREKFERQMAKGIIKKNIRTMVVGIPNVGKSSFINKIAGKASATTGDKPGVTRSKQWIRINEEIELLDTPGILWPKFDSKDVGLNLAYTGAIKDDIYDTIEAASLLLEKLAIIYPKEVSARYKLILEDAIPGYELLEIVGKNRGCVLSGGRIDLERASIIVLDEFRGGKLGRITLERPY